MPCRRSCGRAGRRAVYRFERTGREDPMLWLEKFVLPDDEEEWRLAQKRRAENGGRRSRSACCRRR